MRRHLLLAAFLLVPIVACNNKGGVGMPGGDDDDDAATTATATPDPDPPTYYEDILPIVMANCQSCHTAGSIAAGIDTYSVAASRSALIRDYTAHRALDTDTPPAMTGNAKMPPWPPEESCGQTFKNERRTTLAEKDLFRRWHDAGALEGNPANAPTPFPPPAATPTPNVLFDAGADFAYSGTPVDLYQCFRLDPGISANSDFVRAQIYPGNQAVVHHVILYREPNGASATGPDSFECGGIPSGSEFLVGWTPGAAPLEFPPDTGMRLVPSDRILMQIHYHDIGSPQTDRTKAALWFSPAPVANVARVMWGGALVNIPANTMGHESTGVCTIPSGITATILGVAPHMHTRGTKFDAYWRKAGTADRCMVDIQRWDFEWQGGYMYETPLVLSAGDKILSTCTWDNPTNSSIGFGEGTGDEMCFLFMYVLGAGAAPSQYCFN